MNNKKKIFYGLVGIMILVVTVIGATFAYFTASQSVDNVITGNMASITFKLDVKKVTKVDDLKSGMIPMSNSMVEAAVRDSNDASQKVSLNGNSSKTCVDDNGNAVCQVYKITVENTGTAAVYLDGYVDLTGGSGVSTDVSGAATTMRWAEAFCTDATDTADASACTTVGMSKTGATPSESNAGVKGIGTNWDSIVVSPLTGDAVDGVNFNNLSSGLNFETVTAKGVFGGATEYDIINRNYIRLSGHDISKGYTRGADYKSALVFNQFLDAAGKAKAKVEYYIVVWLSETGTNQTVDSEEERNHFFDGTVSFISAEGSEVTATFSGYTAVAPTDTNAAKK